MNSNTEQFRIIDLTVFSVLSIVTTAMGEYLHLNLPGAGYYLSFSMLIGIVAMIRWGLIGSTPVLVGSFVMVFFGGNSIWANIVMYPLASSFVFIAGYFINKMDREEIVKDAVKLFGFILLSFATLTIGKSFGLLLLGENVFIGGGLYFLSQLFNIVITYVVLLLVRRKDGLLVDMYKYFERHYVEELT